MKASLSWLRSLIHGLDATDQQIVQILSLAQWAVKKCDRSHDDTVLELADTARTDVLGHIGLAREIAALFRQPFEPPVVDAPVRITHGTMRVPIEVKETTACLGFGALFVDNVHVESSPDWLSHRLKTLGHRPDNNVVDITNLVMLEYGHPVEAIDFDRIEGSLEVRFARSGETLQLEDKRLRLHPDDLVIVSNGGPIALAGIAFCPSLHIGANTRRIMLSSVCVDLTSMMRTMQRHGLRSEHSQRPSRGGYREDLMDLLAQAGSLTTHLARGEAVTGSVHIRLAPENLWYGNVRPPSEIGWQQAVQILERLGCEVVPVHGAEGSLQMRLPWFRHDLHNEEDIVKELRRVNLVWTTWSR